MAAKSERKNNTFSMVMLGLCFTAVGALAGTMIGEFAFSNLVLGAAGGAAGGFAIGATSAAAKYCANKEKNNSKESALKILRDTTLQEPETGSQQKAPEPTSEAIQTISVEQLDKSLSQGRGGRF